MTTEGIQSIALALGILVVAASLPSCKEHTCDGAVCPEPNGAGTREPELAPTDPTSITTLTYTNADKHDLAVLTLDTASLDQTTLAMLQAVRPISIAATWEGGKSAAVVGFGITTAGAQDSPIKRGATVFSIDCGNPGHSDFVCFTFDQTGIAVCGGDSGGPMLQSTGSELALIGIAKSTESCAGGEAAYTDVTRQDHSTWIHQNKSAYAPPAGLVLNELTTQATSHGEVTKGTIGNSISVQTSDSLHLVATLNFPRKDKDPVNFTQIMRDFELSLSSAATPATACVNDNAVINMVRYCRHTPVSATGWTAAISPRQGDSGLYQLTITELETLTLGPPPQN